MTKAPPPIEADAEAEAELKAWLHANYPHVRKLPDGSFAAVGRLLFTTALYLGCDRWGYARRFCYPTDAAALGALDALQTEDDEPPPGYIAKR